MKFIQTVVLSFCSFLCLILITILYQHSPNEYNKLQVLAQEKLDSIKISLDEFILMQPLVKPKVDWLEPVLKTRMQNIAAQIMKETKLKNKVNAYFEDLWEAVMQK